MTGEILAAHGSAVDSYKQPNGTNGVALPGTTIPKHDPRIRTGNTETQPEPHSSSGPTVNGRQTAVTLFSPAQLAASALAPPLVHLINEAFRESHVKHGTMPASIDRLNSIAQYINEIGNDPGTFVVVLTWTETGEPIATAGAHRYTGPVIVAEAQEGSTAFGRVRLPADAAEHAREVWELKLMAVDVVLRGRGLATYLMGLVDEEVKRRFRSSSNGMELQESNGHVRRRDKLFEVLSSVKEANVEFYRRRGYVEDYETAHPVGFLGSPDGFHVVHMSKCLDV